MLLARITLSITALIWIIYGGWLFVDPLGFRYTGFELNNWSSIVEVQAMYGAVEFSLGVFALLGIINPRRYMHSALLLWFLIYTALVIGRITGIFMWGGSFSMDFGPTGLPESYNPGALFFLEIPSAILCGIALLKTKDNPNVNPC